MVKLNGTPEIWILTPKNISEYCEKSGASVSEVRTKYVEAKEQNKVLYGFTIDYSKKQEEDRTVEIDSKICRHCEEQIREGEKSVWPWIHTNGFYGCLFTDGTLAEPKGEK